MRKGLDGITHLNTFLSNDGAPQGGKLAYRPLHPMIVRLGPGRIAQDINCACVASLYEVSENSENFKIMFTKNQKYAVSFENHFGNTYGYEKHTCWFVGDGAATPKHVGHGGTGCTCKSTACLPPCGLPATLLPACLPKT